MTLPTLLRASALAAAVLLSTTPALAGRPLQTEDAGVLDAGSCELEGATERLRVLGETARDNALTANCGFGWNSQIGLTLSRASAGGESARGAAIGGKTGLWRGSGDDAAALTLAWSLASAREGGRWQRSEDEIRLVASLPVTAGTLHLNLGHVRERAPKRAIGTWNVAYEHEGFDLGGMNLAPMAEVFGDDRESPWWNLAARWTLVPERVFVDVSWGRQMRDAKARLVTAGFKIAF